MQTQGLAGTSTPRGLKSAFYTIGSYKNQLKKIDFI
jgi:hypothetical protein